MVWVILAAILVGFVLFGWYMSRRQKTNWGAKHYDVGIGFDEPEGGGIAPGSAMPGPEPPYGEFRSVTGGPWINAEMIATPDQQTAEELRKETTEDPDDFIEPANVKDRGVWEEQREAAIRDLKAQNDSDDARRHPTT